MKIIPVKAPTPEQSMAIAAQIWQQLCDEWPVATNDIELADSALDVLSCHAPRLMKKALREAVGRAVYERRAVITTHDIEATIGKHQSPRSYGF